MCIDIEENPEKHLTNTKDCAPCLSNKVIVRWYRLDCLCSL